jgi:hypothetical protein
LLGSSSLWDLATADSFLHSELLLQSRSSFWSDETITIIIVTPRVLCHHHHRHLSEKKVRH